LPISIADLFRKNEDWSSGADNPDIDRDVGSNCLSLLQDRKYPDPVFSLLDAFSVSFTGTAQI
jgi:hypothetical protein